MSLSIESQTRTTTNDTFHHSALDVLKPNKKPHDTSKDQQEKQANKIQSWMQSKTNPSLTDSTLSPRSRRVRFPDDLPSGSSRHPREFRRSFEEESSESANSLDEFALRQEVPFECWYFDHGYSLKLEDPQQLWTARGWALLSLLEGVVRTVIEALAYAVSKIAECCFPLSPSSEQHWDVLRAQAKGVVLSAQAIWSPNDVKAFLFDPIDRKTNEPKMGCMLSQWQWGTLYKGNRDAAWKLECCQYHWGKA